MKRSGGGRCKGKNGERIKDRVGETNKNAEEGLSTIAMQKRCRSDAEGEEACTEGMI